MTLDDYIEGTFNPDNPANWDDDDQDDDQDENEDDDDINEIEVENPEILKTN
jgi:hypothetical protein